MSRFGPPQGPSTSTKIGAHRKQNEHKSIRKWQNFTPDLNFGGASLLRDTNEEHVVFYGPNGSEMCSCCSGKRASMKAEVHKENCKPNLDGRRMAKVTNISNVYFISYTQLHIIRVTNGDMGESRKNLSMKTPCVRTCVPRRHQNL